MELNYDLNKKDYLEYSKELHKNKKLLFECILINKVQNMFLLFISLVLGAVVVFRINNGIFYEYLIYVLIVFVSIELLLIFSCKYYSVVLKNNSRLGRVKPVKIIFNDENINIYSDKLIFPFHKSQILKTVETENYYAFMVNAELHIETIILPKRIFESNENLQDFLKIVDNYKSENNYKFKKSNYIMTELISLSLIVLVFAFYMLPFNDKHKFGATIGTFPVVINVRQNSEAEKIGLKKGDIILEIDNKSMLGQSPMRIIKKLKANNTEVKAIESNITEVKTININN